MHHFTQPMAYLSLFELAQLIATRQVSPVEVIEDQLARIALLNPQLNCYITVMAESARRAAQQAEKDIAQGHYRGALHGIPLALKDNIDTAGTLTTAGAKFFAHHIPTISASVVNKLEQAGAILLGKLNMHEWAMGVIGDNPHYGNVNNPWQPAHICGGSSSGSGAAVAAGLCYGALGTDTGGSIRIPGASCGVVGFKPTYGRVSNQGVIPLSWHLDHVGPMTRSVRDAALILNVLAGYDDSDPSSTDQPTTDYTMGLGQGISGWRIAFAVGPYIEAAAIVHPAITAAVQGAKLVFEQLGATVDEIVIEQLQEARSHNSKMIGADGAAYHEQRLRDHQHDFGSDVYQRLQNDGPSSAMGYALSRRYQQEFRRYMQTFFADYDLLVLPTLAFPPVRHDDQEAMPFVRKNNSRFTAPFNLAGVPAMTLPCGFLDNGLPIGLQLVGPRWGEAKLLRAGYAYEQATTWHQQHPHW